MEYFQIDLQDSGTCDHTRWSSHRSVCQVPSCKKFGQTWSRNAGKRCLNCTWDRSCTCGFVVFQFPEKSHGSFCWQLQVRFLWFGGSKPSVVAVFYASVFFCLGCSVGHWSNSMIPRPDPNWIELMIGSYWLLLVIYWPTQFNDGYIWLYMVIIGDWIGQVLQPVQPPEDSLFGTCCGKSLEVFGWSQWWFQGSQAPNEKTRQTGSKYVNIGPVWNTDSQIGWRVFGFLQVFRVHVIWPKLWFSKWRHVKNPEV